MEYKRALELRNKYHATAGTICIGIDNAQIQMLLADANIDYVIPYHRSGMAKAVRKSMHIPTWSEYENYQSESELSRADAEKQAEKYGVKLLAENDPNYQKHTSFSEWFDIDVAKQIAKMENATPSNKAMQKKYGVMYGGYMAMQNAADTYLKLCAERGLAPVFSNEKADFTGEDNYWKLLIDRKMVDNVTGEIIEQQAVKPVFDQGEILRILNDELERYPGVKADQEYATRKVVEGFLSDKVKGGMSSKAIADVMKVPVDNIAETNILASEEDVAENGGEKFSVREVIGDSGKNYGTGVYLDSTLLDNLTDKERIEMVKEYVKELGGSVFTAYDQNGNAVDVHVMESDKKFKNNSGRRVQANRDLTSYLKNVKQNAIVLIDELVTVSTHDNSKPASHPHGWIDNYGKNNWEYWKVYLQEKNNSVWEATLNIANTANGEKVLYDIVPIKMVEGTVTSVATTTEDSIAQNSKESQDKLSDRDSAGRKLTAEQQEFFKDSKVRDADGNLKVMYHGTSNGGFSVFDIYGGNYGLFGQGLYFTDSKNIAETYTKKGKGNNKQVYEAYSMTMCYDNSASRAKANIIHKYRKCVASHKVVANNSLYEIKATAMPCMYDELFFHDNAEDCKWFHNGGMELLAEETVQALCEMCGVTYKAPVKETAKETATGKIYRVQVGAYSVKANAEAMVKKLKEDGYNPIIV